MDKHYTVRLIASYEAINHKQERFQIFNNLVVDCPSRILASVLWVDKNWLQLLQAIEPQKPSHLKITNPYGEIMIGGVFNEGCFEWVKPESNPFYRGEIEHKINIHQQIVREELADFNIHRANQFLNRIDVLKLSLIQGDWYYSVFG